MFQLLLVIIYISFISLGLPDSLLGAAWPSIYREFGVPISYAGGISMIIALGTVVSSLQSDRLTRRLGTGKVTAFSVLLTAVALFGFSISNSYILLCLWAIPYGLGAGSVDASLNNYVALHYESRHMSWLHCFWGIGATLGPYVMGFALTHGMGWHGGYRGISIIQIILAAILLFSLSLWKSRSIVDAAETESGVDADTYESLNSAECPAAEDRPLKLAEIIRIPGAKEVMICFFCYCSIEQTAGLWASSYLSVYKGISAETAASYAGMFFLGITSGRALSGFITMKLNDTNMVRLGTGLIALGVIVMLLPLGNAVALVGLVLIGLGCAPIYPCLIHSTPDHFGMDRSQAVIGVEMASAYVGTCLMPPLFGIIADRITVALLPIYIVLLLSLLILMHYRLVNNK